MKISPISNVGNNNRKTNFKGHWEERNTQWPIYSRGKSYKIKDYIPDQGESLRDSVFAWEKETGKRPFQWAQENNMYKPIRETNVQYRFNGTPFLPVSLLKKSAEIDLERSVDRFSHTRNKEIESQMNIAWLDAQADNREGVKGNEAELERLYGTEHNAKWGDEEFHLMDIYKKDFPFEVITKRDSKGHE